LRDKPAPHGHHQFSGVRLTRACRRAFAAVVTKPRFRGRQQTVFQAELHVPYHFAGEYGVGSGQGTDCRTIAAIDALVDVVTAKRRDFSAQIKIDGGTHELFSML
jgi:hypothetical protein